MVFVLGVLVNPKMQEKAQSILDDIVGQERLPEYSDRPALKYIDNIVQETYR